MRLNIIIVLVCGCSYVKYFSEILEGTADIEPRAVTIDQIQMRNLPDKVKASGETLHIEIYDYTTTASVLPEDAPVWATHAEQHAAAYSYDESADIATIRVGLPMSGDILIRGVLDKGKKRKHLFLLTLNTSFINTAGGRSVLKFTRKDLDLAFKDKKNGFDDAFQVDLTLLPAVDFTGKMQSTETWARMRDTWQRKFPGLVKQKREPVGQSAQAARAEAIARESRTATLRSHARIGASRSPGAAAAAAAASTNDNNNDDDDDDDHGALADDKLTSWMTNRAAPASNGNDDVVQFGASTLQTSNVAGDRRSTRSRVTLHVVGPDDTDETEQRIVFDVDNDDVDDGAATQQQPSAEIAWLTNTSASTATNNNNNNNASIKANMSDADLNMSFAQLDAFDDIAALTEATQSQATASSHAHSAAAASAVPSHLNTDGAGSRPSNAANRPISPALNNAQRPTLSRRNPNTALTAAVSSSGVAARSASPPRVATPTPLGSSTQTRSRRWPEERSRAAQSLGRAKETHHLFGSRGQKTRVEIERGWRQLRHTHTYAHTHQQQQ